MHWVVRLFNWFIELQQAWAVLVDSYLPLLRECILFHQNGIQHSHKWGTRLPCPILVYWLKVLRSLCSVWSTRLPVSYMCAGWRSWVLGSVWSTEVASWRDWVYFVLSGANLRCASESISPKMELWEHCAMYLEAMTGVTSQKGLGGTCHWLRIDYHWPVHNRTRFWFLSWGD